MERAALGSPFLLCRVVQPATGQGGAQPWLSGGTSEGGLGGGNRSNRDGNRFPESLIYQVGTG